MASSADGDTGWLVTRAGTGRDELRACGGADFELQQPRFAALGRERLGGAGVVLVATIRKDGSPRISPVEPLFWKGDLWLSMGLGTMKARDLYRDPRVLVHSIVTNRDGGDGEFKVRGRAIAEDDPPVIVEAADGIAEELGWRPEVGKFHLFESTWTT